MIDLTPINLKELAFEQEADDDYYLSPEMEAEEIIFFFEQKYGFKKIAS